jgi:hypothetical protein
MEGFMTVLLQLYPQLVVDKLVQGSGKPACRPQRSRSILVLINK